jgi:hypothetical protein
MKDQKTLELLAEQEHEEWIAQKLSEKEEKKEKSKFVNFIKNTLRRASYRWPGRNEALTAARVARGFYKCAVCSVDSFKRTEVNLDHIEPVVPVESDWHLADGSPDWNIFIKRLFVGPQGFQVICINCHDAKTMIEDQMRADYNAERKKEAKEKKKLDKSEKV